MNRKMWPSKYDWKKCCVSVQMYSPFLKYRNISFIVEVTRVVLGNSTYKMDYFVNAISPYSHFLNNTFIFLRVWCLENSRSLLDHVSSSTFDMFNNYILFRHFIEVRLLVENIAFLLQFHRSPDPNLWLLNCFMYICKLRFLRCISWSGLLLSHTIWKGISDFTWNCF